MKLLVGFILGMTLIVTMAMATSDGCITGRCQLAVALQPANQHLRQVLVVDHERLDAEIRDLKGKVRAAVQLIGVLRHGQVR